MARKKHPDNYRILSDHWGDGIDFSVPALEETFKPDKVINEQEHQLHGNGHVDVEAQEQQGRGDRKRGKNTDRERRRRERKGAEEARGRWE